MLLDQLLEQIRACRICRDCPRPGASPLPQEPRPIVQASGQARICIAGQAPGKQAHEHGRPFYDASGRRLRDWLDVDETRFYDPGCFAIIPMGFCFPGYDAKGADRPPRKECRDHWHDALFAKLPRIELVLAIGQHAHNYHIPKALRRRRLRDNVHHWRQVMTETREPRVIPLPHPSWRNNAWLRDNPWFEQELIPELRAQVHHRLPVTPPGY